ncbi:MAG: wax ester/triacylglycerol synthase domain-containing protein [Acidimicrobiales bacterium]
MSDHEALMWNVEKDPWLNPNGAALVILDRPIDMVQFRRRIRAMVAQVPRLHERVVPGLGRLSPPSWTADPEFDFDHHLRELNLPAPGTDRQLLDLAAQLYEEPLDRTRPLWRFVIINGLSDGRGALFSILHHAIADGMGQLRLAEMFQELGPDEELPPDVDLEAMVAEAASEPARFGGDLSEGLVNTTTHTLGHVVRRQVGIARRFAGEVAVWPADPRRAGEKVGEVTNLARSTIGQLTGSGSGVEGGSPLWKTRSRRRHLEHVSVPLDDVKKTAKALGGSVNDLYVAALVEAAVRYHHERGVAVDAFNTSFVVSTRTDDTAGGNAFTPVPVQLSGRPMSLPSRFVGVRDELARKRTEAEETGGLSALSGVINLLPTSVVTGTARSQAAKMDFATSNLRGAPIPLYVSGARVLTNITMGPVAGTAANITTLSYAGNLDIGIFVDPAAIADPGDLRDHIGQTFADFFALET